MAWLTAAAALTATALTRAESSAPARHLSAALEYVAPPKCPSSDDFRGAVIGRLGFDPFSQEAALHVLATISTSERPLEGRLEWRDAEGNWAGDQTFRAHNDDCAELARTMGLALAVQIHLLEAGEPLEGSNPRTADGKVSASATGASATDAPAAAVPPAATSNAKVSDEPAPSGSDASASSTPWSFAIGGGGALGLGMSPGPTMLGRVFGTLAYGFLSFELGGELSTETSEERPDGAGFTQRAVLASAAVCGSQGPVSLCAVGKGGVLKVAGQQIDVPASSDSAAFQAGLRLAVRERIGRSAFLGQRLEGLANLTRWTVTLDQIPVWTAPPVAGTLGIDVGVIFE
jgi:hypothetical protein